MTYELSGSNLLFYGFGRDVNGNTIGKLGFPNQTGFSIQTNGNMPKTHSLRGSKDLTDENLKVIEKEAIDYIQKYGTAKQQSSLRIYTTARFTKKVEAAAEEALALQKNIKDQLLDGMTFEELIVTVQSNTPERTPEAVMKEYEEILKFKLADAKHELETNMKWILKEIGK